MTTLRIEHASSDIDTWANAFHRFEDARRQAGVRSHRLHRPADSPRYIMIDLDFDTPRLRRHFGTS